MLLSTINRTTKAYLLAIVGAEYVLRWLPVGTHQWERFVTPDELGRHLAAAGLGVPSVAGAHLQPVLRHLGTVGRHRRQLLRGRGQARLSEAFLYLSSRLTSPGLAAYGHCSPAMAGEPRGELVEPRAGGMRPSFDGLRTRRSVWQRNEPSAGASSLPAQRMASAQAIGRLSGRRAAGAWRAQTSTATRWRRWRPKRAASPCSAMSARRRTSSG